MSSESELRRLNTSNDNDNNTNVTTTTTILDINHRQNNNETNEDQHQPPTSPQSPAISTSSSSCSSSATQQQQQTPLNKRIFVPLILTLFMESISYVTPMPFMGNYVAHLLNAPIVESGRYSGIIVGCFYAGTILSGSWWGRISDQFGRKPVILFGLTVSAVLELLFGLATNIWTCMLVRLLQGVFNGMQATSKTVIAESTDSTNEAFGFSLMTLAWSGGTFIGMAVGGWLYDVGDPQFFGHSFPAFLPCLIMSLFALVCVASIYWIFPETNPRVMPLSWNSLREFLVSGGVVTVNNHVNVVDDLDTPVKKSHQRHPSSSSSMTTTTATKSPTTSSLENITTTNDDSSSSSNTNTNINTNNNNNNEVRDDGEKQQLINNATNNNNSSSSESGITFWNMWKMPALRAALIDYLLLSSHEIAFDEVFPLLAVSPGNVAGLAMTVSEVGVTIMYAGFFMIASVYAFPIVRKWYGDYVYVYASIILCFCYIAIPQLEIAAANQDDHRHLPLALIVPFRTWANDFCYSQSLLMIPRSAPDEQIGTVTSMSTSAAAVIRLMIPPIASALFSFSVTEFVWMYPFNSTLVFALCSFLALAGAVHRRNWIAKIGNTGIPTTTTTANCKEKD